MLVDLANLDTSGLLSVKDTLFFCFEMMEFALALKEDDGLDGCWKMMARLSRSLSTDVHFQSFCFPQRRNAQKL